MPPRFDWLLGVMDEVETVRLDQANYAATADHGI